MNNLITFKVQGSSDEPYLISFLAENKIECTCGAGKAKQLCKHILSLIEGDVSNILGHNAADVSNVLASLSGSEFMIKYEELKMAMKDKLIIESKIKALKKNLERISK